jgi:hypothetical protein
MADQTTKELVIELTLENTQLKTKLGEVNDGLNKTKKASENFVSSLKAGWLAVALAIGVAVNTIKKMVTDTLEAERNMNKLVTAMRNQGVFTRELLRDYKDYAKSLQAVTTFEDDQIIVLQAQLTQFGLTGQALKDVTKATLDLAQSQGMDLQQAGTLVGKTINSNTNALSRYGITTITAKDSTDRARQAVEGLGRVFGGQAEASAKTFEGRLKQIKNQAQDFKEDVGKGILIGITPLIDKFREFSNSAKGLKVIESVSKGLAIAFVIAGGIIGQVVANMINFFREISIVATTLGNVFKKLFSGDIKGALEELKEGAKDFGTLWIDVGKGVIENVKAVAEGVKKIQNGVDEVIEGTNKKIQEFREIDAQKQEEINKFILDGTADTEQKKLELKIKTAKEYAELEKGINEEQYQTLLKMAVEFENQLKIMKLSSALDTANQISSGVQNINSQINKNAEIDADNRQKKELERLQESLDNKTITEEEYNTKKDEIDKKFRLESAKRQREQAKFDKASNIFNVLIETAKNIVKAFPNPILMGLAGALGGAQVASIGAQPLPEVPKFAQGGMISGLNSPFGGEDGMIGVRNGESVLNQTATAVLGRDAIETLNSGRGIQGGVNISINGGNPNEIVSVLNGYFRQYGTSTRGVAV